MRKWLAIMAVAGLGAAPPLGSARGEQDGKYANDYKGKAPPELASDKADWFNATEAIKLEKLKGKVVWLEFSFLN
jgi:hypothetical protein